MALSCWTETALMSLSYTSLVLLFLLSLLLVVFYYIGYKNIKKSNFIMGLIIFIAFIGIIGTIAIGVVVYRNRDIVFPKKSTT